MADTAFTSRYREETIMGFERATSLLRDTVTTDTETKGNQVYFLIADSGGATAVTRGVNGLIPARPDNLSQVPITLTEWHDLVRKTSYNIFASQGDQRAIMQKTSRMVIYRKVDDQILTALSAATLTLNTGAAVAGSISLLMNAITRLTNSSIPFDGNFTALITPATFGEIGQLTEFLSRDFRRDAAPIEKLAENWRDSPNTFEWMGFRFIVHNGLPGLGTATATNYIYHKSAIGHAMNTAGITTNMGFDEEQDYSFVRTSVFMGAALLQNAGVLKWTHDDTVLSAL